MPVVAIVRYSMVLNLLSPLVYPPPYTARTVFEHPDLYPPENKESPKSIAFPVDEIVMNSITFRYEEPSLPPRKTPRVGDDAAPF